MSFFGKIGLYFSKIWEFVSDDPRESNTEGGVFPAIFGTVLMVLIMSIVVLPLGVIAAVYLNEYAKPGKFLNFVRICVNNLAQNVKVKYTFKKIKRRSISVARKL